MRGYPDFFGYSLFPRYGIPVGENKMWTNVPNGGVETIFSIAGGGRTYGGFVKYYGDEDLFNMTAITAILDGVAHVSEAVSVELEYGIPAMRAQPFVLSQYEQRVVEQHVCYTGVPEWTFNTSMVVTLQNESGDHIHVMGRMYWGRIM